MKNVAEGLHDRDSVFDRVKLGNVDQMNDAVC
jgi:hypothetical protein